MVHRIVNKFRNSIEVYFIFLTLDTLERQETAAGTKRSAECLEVEKSVKSLKQRLTQVEEKQSSAEPVVIPGKKKYRIRLD